VSLKEKPYASAKDLAGKPIAFASRTSTSGYVVPVASLVKSQLLKREANPEEFFGKGNVNFGTGYVSAIAKVLDGSVEAAAVSDYVIDGDKHLKPEEKARLKIVARQGPVPTHVIATANALKRETRNKVEKALTSIPAELRDQLFNSELVKVNAKTHLRPTKKNFEMTGITL
jgi:phosphonate transport system substrate-binding protein